MPDAPRGARKTPLPLLLACCAWAAQAAEPGAPGAKVPGVVIDHVPATSGLYVGSPSLAVLPGGGYVASHDFFGPQSGEQKSARTAVFGSADRGASWRRLAEIQGAFWSTLFVHRGALYLLGTDRHHGNAVIRRSRDGGATWTAPTNATTGLLRANGEYHCAPMPVLEHDGRLWRGMEWRHPAVGWGINYRAAMLSVPVDADLLNAACWTLSEPLPSSRLWNGGDMGAWLEGNAVVAPDGGLLDVLRVQTQSPDEKAAIVRIDADGRAARFDPATGFVPFPGGAKKFTIRFDPRSRLYWSLASIVHERHRARNPGGIRNTLALTCSPGLTNWTVRCILLYHPDVAKHGFQYVDWQFDGDDIIAAVRTAYDDGQGGARNNHDANYLTFHRFARFRELTPADSAPVAELPASRVETADVNVTGRGWSPATLADGGKAFANRAYVWADVPARFRGWRYTRTAGGERAEIAVKALRDTTVHLAAGPPPPGADLAGWTELPGLSFRYTDAGRTALQVFTRSLQAGESLALPRGGWAGALLLLPPDAQGP